MSFSVLIADILNRFGFQLSRNTLTSPEIIIHKFGNPAIIHARDGSKRVFRHRGSRADVGVLRQIFRNGDYDIRKLQRAPDLLSLYRTTLLHGRTPLIVDAGANIGASAFWFSAIYPESHVVCFEPDIDNFKFLKSNTSNCNVELHQAAVGSIDGSVDIIDPGIGEWGYRATPSPNGAVKMMSLNRIVSEKIERDYEPFIIKIDIEGGEEELFAKNTDWVDRFPLLIIELHDWMLPRKNTSSQFLKVISALNRDFVYIGENVFSIRN